MSYNVDRQESIRKYPHDVGVRVNHGSFQSLRALNFPDKRCGSSNLIVGSVWLGTKLNRIIRAYHSGSYFEDFQVFLLQLLGIYQRVAILFQEMVLHTT
jgi:hypothetical protein